jgi:flagellin-like protein
VNGRRPPTMKEPSDVVGGILHLLAEIGGLVVLLAVALALAWVMLRII